MDEVDRGSAPLLESGVGPVGRGAGLAGEESKLEKKSSDVLAVGVEEPPVVVSTNPSIWIEFGYLPIPNPLSFS